MARFLVVDDDPSTVNGLALLLADDGHDVSSFTTGADALEALARESFDAVVTDLGMQGVDGYAVMRAAREHQPDACLVILTGKADQAAARLAGTGACVIADKPLEYEDLIAAVVACRRCGGAAADERCRMSEMQREPAIVSMIRR